MLPRTSLRSSDARGATQEARCASSGSLVPFTGIGKCRTSANTMSEFAEHLNYSNDVEIAAWGLAANTLAAVSPLGIVSMGTFPSSLVALGRISRWHLDEAPRLQQKGNQ